jgi:hypothetical protein
MPPDRQSRNSRILAATLSSAEAAAGASIPQIVASLELDPAVVARAIRDAARRAAPD